MVTQSPDSPRAFSPSIKPLAAAVATATLLAGFGSAAVAESAFYVGAAGLASHLEPDTNDTSYEITEDSSGGYKGILGVDLNDWIGLEVNLGDLGAAELSSTARTGEITYKSWNLSSVLYWPDAIAGFRPFVKAGVGDVEVQSTNSIEYEEVDGPVITAGLGLEYLFRQGFSLRTEFDYLDKDAQTVSLGVIKRFKLQGIAPSFTDADGDGVGDALDHCDGTPPATAVLSNGCAPAAPAKPMAIADADGDSVADEYDRCPNTPLTTMVMANGCPPDSDYDGVYDNKDNCPATPAGKEVGVDGCIRSEPVVIPAHIPEPIIAIDPIVMEPSFYDSDLDGIEDSVDRCPSSQQGLPVDEFGCAEFYLASGVLDGVNFQTASVLLTEPAKLKLNEAANALLKDQSVRVLIIGHTDDIGSAEGNRTLSYDRAKAVSSYLAMRGVDTTRLRYVGKGEQTPVATNSTSEGRAQNRRVEIIVGQ